VWDEQAQRPNDVAALNDVIDSGYTVIRKTKQYITEVLKNAIMTTFEGHRVPLVNCPQHDISETLHELAKRPYGNYTYKGATHPPFAMGWWQRGDGRFQYSLRSIGDFDVSALAKKHGGGGHKNAAG
jgi:hypothetical protein